MTQAARQKPKRIPTNDELVADAGKIYMDPPASWGRGIIKDFKGTVGTNWVKEMTNFNIKTIGVTCLMFVAVISPTLSFGAAYGGVTNNQIGAIETIIATGWVGMAHALIGGMPMVIVGSTGPVLALTTAIVNMADSLDVPYISWNCWISLWLLGYCFTAAFFDLTRVVRLATRFTDEIFALLIVSIFVMDAVGDPFSSSGLIRYLQPSHPSHEDQGPDYEYLTTGFLSCILGFGTTWLIFVFRSFKFSPFFCNDTIRTSLHDFAVIMSVIIWTGVKEGIFPTIETQKLKVPETFEPSFSCCDSSCATFFPDDCPDQEERFGTRPWLVDWGNLNGKSWAPIAAAGPAIFAFLLCFLDNGITWHLVMHPSHKITNGEAYNYDLMMSGIFNFVNGLMGFPWLVATTVPCIVHVHSLANKDEKGNIIDVQETRLTGFLAHLLVLVSAFALSVLRLLPVPVLLGVFLFMGLSSLTNMQLWHRLLLFIQQPSKHPKTIYNEYMDKSRVHKYTLLQVVFFFGIFTVMNIKTIAIAFPFMTLLCIPARMYFMPLFFEGWELNLLDGDDDKIKEWTEAKEESMRSLALDEDEESAASKADVDVENA